MIKLDTKDKKILALLIHFSRFSLSTIAKNVQLSRENIDYRIKRMMRLGIIKEFTINLYLNRFMHMHLYDIFLRIEKIGIKEKDEIIKKLTESTYTLKVEECEGKWNLYLGVLSDDTLKVKMVLERIILLCQHHLSDIIIFPVARKSFTERLFFLESVDIQKVKGKSSDAALYRRILNIRANLIGPQLAGKKPCEVLKLDDMDKKLISLLRDNSRLSLTAMGKELGISSNAVNYRLRKMIDHGLIAYFTPVIDFQKLSYTRAYLFLSLMENNPKKEALLNSLNKDKRTEYFNYYLGRWPYVFTFIVKDNLEFQEILYKICEEYSDIILDYHILWSTKIHKWTAIPEDINLFSS